jgi:hypothetical protein
MFTGLSTTLTLDFEFERIPASFREMNVKKNACQARTINCRDYCGPKVLTINNSEPQITSFDKNIHDTQKFKFAIRIFMVTRHQQFLDSFDPQWQSMIPSEKSVLLLSFGILSVSCCAGGIYRIRSSCIGQEFAADCPIILCSSVN